MNLHAARTLALSLLRQHGLTTWTFRFDHARRRFGSCSCARRTITLSRVLTFLNPEPDVRETILHEIAHALTQGDAHGAKWRAKCRELGIEPERCFQEGDVVTLPRHPPRWLVGCCACNWWVPRRRRQRGQLVCRRCRGPVIYKPSLHPQPATE